MADKKISALTAASTPLAGNEVLPIVQSGSTVKVPVSDLTAGRAVSAASLTASTGNVNIGTAGQGVSFAANTNAAGMTSELLNWYEEGTFTPVVAASSGTLTSYVATASYVRVGRVVTVFASVKITDVGTGSGGLAISGYPFASQNLGADTITAGIGIYREGAVTGNTGAAFISKNSTSGVVVGAIGTGYVFEWTLVYQAA